MGSGPSVPGGRSTGRSHASNRLGRQTATPAVESGPAPYADTVSFEGARAVLSRVEAELLESAGSDLAAELSLSHDAAAFLLAVLSEVGFRTGKLEVDADGQILGGDVATIQLAAQTVIGVRALRVIRAARRVLSVGYEPEARAHDRILIELQAHRGAILADPSGAEALAWLRGERGYGITKRVKAVTPEGLYKSLSQDSHGDPVPVWDLFDAEVGHLELAPRRTASSRGSLLMHAGFARDQAVVIAGLAGIEVEGVDELDAAIRSAISVLDAD